MRMVMALVGYLSTATVLSLVIGLGYLWQTQRLDDEKAFRIIALVHDVDIDALEAETAKQDASTPEEEASLEDIERFRAVHDRNYEVKMDSLKRGRDAFNFATRKLEDATSRFSELATKIETELKNQGELASKESVAKVVRDLELLGAEEAKALLVKTLEQPDGMSDVIKLMNAMSPSKLRKILQRFRTEEELNHLHDIHRVMLSGGPLAQKRKEALEELKTPDAQR